MTKNSVSDDRKGCTIRVWVSPDQKRAIQDRMRPLKFSTESDYLRWLLRQQSSESLNV